MVWEKEWSGRGSRGCQFVSSSPLYYPSPSRALTTHMLSLLQILLQVFTVMATVFGVIQGILIRLRVMEAVEYYAIVFLRYRTFPAQPAFIISSSFSPSPSRDWLIGSN